MRSVSTRGLGVGLLWWIFSINLQAQQAPVVYAVVHPGSGYDYPWGAGHPLTWPSLNFSFGDPSSVGFSVASAVGAASGTVSMKVNNNSSNISFTLGSFDIYVRGGPGTPFHLEWTCTDTASATVNQVGLYEAAVLIAGGNCGGGVGLQALSYTGQNSLHTTVSNNGTTDGTTSAQTTSNPAFPGVTYSYASSFGSGWIEDGGQNVGGSANNGIPYVGSASLSVNVTFTVTTNTTTPSIRLLSVDDTDPNNAVIRYMVTGDVGQVHWGIDGNVSNSLGAPAVGTNTFTVPNIKGLANSLHILEVIGMNNGMRYADSTQLDTSNIADQPFSPSWQILVTNLSFDELPHNDVWATGAVHKSQIIWGIPGQQYDRFLASVSTILNSFIPADAPNSFTTTAIPNFQVAWPQLHHEGSY